MTYEYCFYLYIMASTSGTLYAGITGNLAGRVQQHKNDEIPGFTKKYHCHKLVYYEEYQYVDDAIAREKQLKTWNRNKKEILIKSMNPQWKDLSEGWTT